MHVATEFVLDGNYIDPEKWTPLIYNFRHYYRLAEKELGKLFGQSDRGADSKLALFSSTVR